MGRILRVRRHVVTQPDDPLIRLIPLTQGQNAIVDADDYDRLSQFNWYANWSKGGRFWYVVRNCEDETGKRTQRRMHREVLQDCEAPHIDHVNGNPLDNRKINLRAATRSQNAFNSKRSGSLSGWRGVSKSGNRWTAKIHKDGKKYHLGSFATKEEAYMAYSQKAQEFFGKFHSPDRYLSIPLNTAALCMNCQCITQSTGDTCSYCACKGVVSLQRWLNREETSDEATITAPAVSIGYPADGVYESR